MDHPDDAVFQPGDVLFDTAEPLTTAYFVLEGQVEIELFLNDRAIQLVIGPNQFIGDAGVAVGQKTETAPVTYRARAVAIERVRAAAVPIDDIKQELAACPPLLKAWIASFVSRVLLVVDELSRSENVV